MKNLSRHIGTLEVLARLPSSAAGNPRYRVSIAGVSCRTAVDAAIAYEVTNWEGKRVEATIGTHYGAATLNSLKAAA